MGSRKNRRATPVCRARAALKRPRDTVQSPTIRPPAPTPSTIRSQSPPHGPRVLLTTQAPRTRSRSGSPQPSDHDSQTIAGRYREREHVVAGMRTLVDRRRAARDISNRHRRRVIPATRRANELNRDPVNPRSQPTLRRRRKTNGVSHLRRPSDRRRHRRRDIRNREPRHRERRYRRYALRWHQRQLPREDSATSDRRASRMRDLHTTVCRRR